MAGQSSLGRCWLALAGGAALPGGCEPFLKKSNEGRERRAVLFGHDNLACHLLVPIATKHAAVKWKMSGFVWLELDLGWGARLDFSMDIELRRIEPVTSIGRRKLKLHELALLDGDDGWLELEFLCGHLDNPSYRNGGLGSGRLLFGGRRQSARRKTGSGAAVHE
jgi:hypothetical protein